MCPFLYLEGNKLGCCSLRDAWRRPTTAGSGRKMTPFLMEEQAARPSAYLLQFPSSFRLAEAMRSGQEEVSTGDGLQRNRGTLHLGNSVCLQSAVSVVFLCSCVSRLLLYKYTWKDSPDKTHPMPPPTKHWEMQYLMKHVP